MAKRMPVEEVDGCDPAVADKRDFLFSIATDKNYPLVFLEGRNGFKFMGNYARMEEMNEIGDTPPELLEKFPELVTFNQAFACVRSARKGIQGIGTSTPPTVKDLTPCSLSPSLYASNASNGRPTSLIKPGSRRGSTPARVLLGRSRESTPCQHSSTESSPESSRESSPESSPETMRSPESSPECSAKCSPECSTECSPEKSPDSARTVHICEDDLDSRPNSVDLRPVSKPPSGRNTYTPRASSTRSSGTYVIVGPMLINPKQ